MYLAGGTNENGDEVALYFPFASWRAQCLTTPTRPVGYIYTYINYQCGATYTTAGYTQYHGSALQFGYVAATETAAEKLYLERTQRKKNNAQAYNVRCRKFGN